MSATVAQPAGFVLMRTVFKLCGPAKLPRLNRAHAEGSLAAFLDDDWPRDNGPELHNFKLSKFLDYAATYIWPMPLAWIALISNTAYVFKVDCEGGWRVALDYVSWHRQSSPLVGDPGKLTVTWVPHDINRLDAITKYTFDVSELSSKTLNYIKEKSDLEESFEHSQSPPQTPSGQKLDGLSKGAGENVAPQNTKFQDHPRIIRFPARERDLSWIDTMLLTDENDKGSMASREEQEGALGDKDGESQNRRNELIAHSLELADRWVSSPATSPRPPPSADVSGGQEVADGELAKGGTTEEEAKDKDKDMGEDTDEEDELSAILNRGKSLSNYQEDEEPNEWEQGLIDK